MRCRVPFALLAVFALTACSHPAPPAAPPAAPAAVAADMPAVEAPPAPSCNIESSQEHKLGDTHIRIWSLRPVGVRSLAARLMFAKDGKVERGTEIEYELGEWQPGAKPASGQLLFVMQDGAPFGAKGKRLPQLTLDLKDVPGHSRVGRAARIFVGPELDSRSSGASYATPLGPKSVLYSEVFIPRDSKDLSVKLSSEWDSAVEASKGGRTVVFVELEWSAEKK